MSRAILFAITLLAACTSRPAPAPDAGELGGAGGGVATSSSSSSSSTGQGGAGGEQPLPEPDAGPPCLPNGGITCVQDSDCPSSMGCDFCFRCVVLPDGTRACRSFSTTSGQCNVDEGPG